MNGFGNPQRYNINEIITSIERQIKDIKSDFNRDVIVLQNKLNNCVNDLDTLRTKVNEIQNYTETEYQKLQTKIEGFDEQIADIRSRLNTISYRSDSEIVGPGEAYGINNKDIWANHAVQDNLGRPITATYATKAELNASGTYLDNKIDSISAESISGLSGVSAILQNEIDTEISRATNKENEIVETINTKETELLNTIDTVSSTLSSTFDDKIIEVSGSSLSSLSSVSSTLNQSIETEVQRATDIEQTIIDNLTGEVRRAQNREEELDTKIEGEITRASGAEELLNQSNVDETIRAMSAENVLSGKLSDEITRATNKETLLQQNIDTLSGAVDEKESALNTKIEAETTRATSAENDLETAISNEVTARETAVNILENDIANEAISRHNEIDIVTNNLTEEVNRANEAEEALASKIDSSVETINDTISGLNTTFSQALTQEQNTRSAADTTLQTNIDNEATARSEADTTLQTNIDNEATARENKDTALSGAISDEATARTNADETLQSNIDAEENARIARDTELQNQIDTIEATQNIVDIVGTKADLDDYDTTYLKDGAKIQVLDDETQNHASTIYQFNKNTVHNPSFGLVGTFGSYYTKAETDGLITSARNDFTSALNTETSARTDADTLLSGRIDNLESTKQNNLSAGDGIDITNDVVSHSIKIIENNNQEDFVEGTVFTVYLKNNHYKMITFDKTITEIIFMIEKSATGILQETGFEFTVPEDSELETLTFKVIDDNNKKIYTIIPDSYSSPNIYQGTIVNYRCTIGEYEVED